MKTKLSFAAALTALAACTAPLTPEERAKQTDRNLPLAAASVPACISAASGQNPNYSSLVALGYENYKPLTKSGVNFRSKDSSFWSSVGTDLNFKSNIGCEASYSNETDSFQAIGNAWVTALKDEGYSPSATKGGSYTFVANGVPMRFRGTHQISNHSNVMTFKIQRGDR
ncbi:hypothetical protein [Ruegeria jejuensis]|uniref:hypothetical protein n=1 Tax=Ruegeria jejuensis TaxID=3233338 RepID=UPI00355B7654